MSSRVELRYAGEADRSDAEEWVTTKKVEIVTTKNVERKVQRQVVLEDGRVMEEEIPTVTVDTTEDKQTFETDQDEERNLERVGNTQPDLSSKFDTSGGVLVGDKFTRVKKTNDVRESLVKTEAMQSLGNISNRNVRKVVDTGDDIRNYLRKRKDQDQQVIKTPKTVFTSRNHRVVTDKEDVQERNWVNKGKMQNERIKTEEHIEYDSGNSPDDEGSTSSSSKSSHHKIGPETYKTRKDENFTEYYKTGLNNNNKVQAIKVGAGPHYVSESKEVVREDDDHLRQQVFQPSRVKQMPRNLLAEVDAHDRINKKTINHTDSWLERHFGSTSSLSVSSAELSRSGSVEGYGLRRSASICDIRPVSNSSNVYYATVRKSGKVPEVKLREKPNKNFYAANRVSADFSSTGQPIRPPRRTKNTNSESFSYPRSPQKHHLKENNSTNISSRDGHVTEKYYFGNPQTVKHSTGGLNRSYSSVQNLHQRSELAEHRQRAENMGQTLDRKKEKQHVGSRTIGTGYSTHDRSNYGDIYSNKKSKSRDDPQVKRSREMNSNSQQVSFYGDKVKQHSRETQSKIEQVSFDGDEVKKGRMNIHSSSKHKKTRQIGKSPDTDQTTKEQQYHSAHKENIKVNAENIYDTPHRIIYTMDAPVGSPSNKYRTRIVINGDGL